MERFSDIVEPLYYEFRTRKKIRVIEVFVLRSFCNEEVLKRKIYVPEVLLQERNICIDVEKFNTNVSMCALVIYRLHNYFTEIITY